MGIKSYSSNMIETKYSFQRKSGRSIIERRPVFSPDQESVLVIVEDVVRVYNIQTSDCVRILETETKVEELVSIGFPENEDYNLYGCSNTGIVTTWTWENGAVLREINLKLPPEARVVTFDLIDNTKCFVTTKTNSKLKKLHLATYCLKTGDLLTQYTHKDINCTELVRVALGWCYGFRFAAISNGTKILTIQNLEQPHVCTYLTNSNQIRIMSVAAHHKDNAIAYTDALGRVTILRGNLFDYTAVAKEQLHWHFLPTFAVCFSQQGSYLYSGGIEEVLIKWTLGNLSNKSNEKEFIPRLPGIIRFITVSNTHVAITLSNNSIAIASTRMRVLSTIVECGGLSPAARAIGTSFVFHHRSASLLMGGRTGHLQVYSPASDKVLYNIDVTNVNKISAQRDNLMPLETEVTCAAVNRDGGWLVTSEYRNDGLMYPEEKLKFWAFKGKHGPSYQLNTCVSLSHGGSNVVSLALDNRGEFCVSAGLDQKFRIWKRESQKTTEGKKVIWSCLTACYYSSGIAQFTSSDALNKFKVGDDGSMHSVETRPYMLSNSDDIVVKIFKAHKNGLKLNYLETKSKCDKSMDMGGVAMSQDASLIAAWFGCKLTLWDTHLCALRTVLAHPALRPKGNQVEFGGLDAAHYLVCTTDSVLAVWSLLSLSIKWLVQTHPTCLTADRFSNRMAITTKSNDVYVFTPHSSASILTRKSVLEPGSGAFTLCTFGASSGDDFRLYLMRNNTEVYSLEPEKREEDSLEVISRRNLPTSNFGALLAETQLSGVRQAAPVDTNAEGDAGSASVLQFLSASPHMVPPVSLLCTSFLQQMSGQKQEEEPSEDKEDHLEVDEDSSDDEHTVKENDAPQISQFWTPSYEQVKEKKLNKMLKEPFLDLHITSTICGL